MSKGTWKITWWKYLETRCYKSGFTVTLFAHLHTTTSLYVNNKYMYAHHRSVFGQAKVLSHDLWVTASAAPPWCCFNEGNEFWPPHISMAASNMCVCHPKSHHHTVHFKYIQFDLSTIPQETQKKACITHFCIVFFLAITLATIFWSECFTKKHSFYFPYTKLMNFLYSSLYPFLY